MEATPEGRAAAWFLLVAPGAANAAGHALDLYARFRWLDRIPLACTIFAAAFWLALLVCCRVLRGGRGREALLALVIAGVGLAVGALWEVAEWGFDRTAPGGVIEGKHDTITDTVMDTPGALGAGLAGLKSLKPAENPPAAAAAPRAP